MCSIKSFYSSYLKKPSKTYDLGVAKLRNVWEIEKLGGDSLSPTFPFKNKTLAKAI